MESKTTRRHQLTPLESEGRKKPMSSSKAAREEEYPLTRGGPVIFFYAEPQLIG